MTTTTTCDGRMTHTHTNPNQDFLRTFYIDCTIPHHSPNSTLNPDHCTPDLSSNLAFKYNECSSCIFGLEEVEKMSSYQARLHVAMR